MANKRRKTKRYAPKKTRNNKRYTNAKRKIKKKPMTGGELVIITVLVVVAGFAWVGSIAPSTSLGQSANIAKCGIYNASGMYPNKDAREVC